MIRRCKYSRLKVDDMETLSLVKEPTIQSQKRWPRPEHFSINSLLSSGETALACS